MVVVVLCVSHTHTHTPFRHLFRAQRRRLAPLLIPQLYRSEEMQAWKNQTRHQHTRTHISTNQGRVALRSLDQQKEDVHRQDLPWQLSSHPFLLPGQNGDCKTIQGQSPRMVVSEVRPPFSGCVFGVCSHLPERKEHEKC